MRARFSIKTDVQPWSETLRRLFRFARAAARNALPISAVFPKVAISFSAISVVMGPKSGRFSTRRASACGAKFSLGPPSMKLGYCFLELVSLLGR